jgi:hypothetical protein
MHIRIDRCARRVRSLELRGRSSTSETTSRPGALHRRDAMMEAGRTTPERQHQNRCHARRMIDCAPDAVEHYIDLKGLGCQRNGAVNLPFRFGCCAAIKGS